VPHRAGSLRPSSSALAEGTGATEGVFVGGRDRGLGDRTSAPLARQGYDIREHGDLTWGLKRRASTRGTSSRCQLGYRAVRRRVRIPGSDTETPDGEVGGSSGRSEGPGKGPERPAYFSIHRSRSYSSPSGFLDPGWTPTGPQVAWAARTLRRLCRDWCFFEPVRGPSELFLLPCFLFRGVPSGWLDGMPQASPDREVGSLLTGPHLEVLVLRLGDEQQAVPQVLQPTRADRAARRMLGLRFPGAAAAPGLRPRASPLSRTENGQTPV
jgi:hypothetical protein